MTRSPLRRFVRTATTRSGRRPHCAPRLEALEDRTVPSPIAVSNLDDTGPGSLRQAIINANNLSGDDTITFEVTGTVNLASALPSLSTNIAIQPSGANRLTVRGATGGANSIFTVTGGATVVLSGLTISNGQAGGIWNAGKLTLNNATISGNSTSNYGNGAGIYNTGTLEVTASILSGNETGGYGGGIYNSSGTVTVTNSTLSGNDGASGGGGIYNASGTVTVTASTLSDNIAALSGGGIYNAGTLMVTNSTLSGNQVWWVGSGGGIYNAGTLTVTNSTISGNFAADYGISFYGGGGVSNGGTFYCRNTIIAGNAAETTPFADLLGSLTSWGHNLIGNPSGGSGFAPTDLVGSSSNPIDPRLGGLQDNGGPTWTQALLPDSPAINAGDPAATGDYDQRGPGFARIVNGRIDIGAFEVQTPGNTPPVAQGGSLTTNENTAKAGTLVATDTDNDPLTYSIVNGPAHGALTSFDSATGVFTYTPALNFHGADSFTFKANDGMADSHVAAVSITVIDITPPAAQNQSVTVNENTATPITLAATDDDGDSLTYTVVSPPAHGTLSGSGANLTYTPFANYEGFDGFTFKANDGSQDSNTATVSIAVIDVTQPMAQDQSVSTPVNKAKSITLTATDGDGDPLTYIVVSGPAHGNLSASGANVIYTPAAGYVGSDSFTFKANDGTLVSNVATVSITVTSSNTPPAAQDQSVSTAEDTAKPITLAATDVDNDPLAYTVVSGPAHGTLSGSGANRIYTPAVNYNGPDSFTFKANDGTVDSNTATVSIMVNPVNDAPAAQNQSVGTAEDTAKPITLAATDVDGDSLTYTVVSGPSHGTLSGSGANRTYTPAANYNGPDSFTFRANDGQANSNIATVSITVTPVNDAPVAQSQSVSTPVNTARAITLAATDVDGDSLTYTVVSGPSHGTLSGSGANRTYTPAANYNGPDSFTFKANDGTVDSNVATVSITVTPVSSGNLIVNPGFETGNFSGWKVTPAPYSSYFGVGGHQRSGRYAAYFGSYDFARDDIYQNLPTIPGHTYSISYWIANGGGGYTEIRSSWGGAVLEDLFPANAFGYQQHTFTRVATSTSTEFRIGGYQLPAYWYLDDVSVTDKTAPGMLQVARGSGIAKGNSVADAVFAATLPGSLASGGVQSARLLSAYGPGGFASSGGLVSPSAGLGAPTRGALPGVNLAVLDEFFAFREVKLVSSLGRHRLASGLGDEFGLPGLPA